MVAAGLPASPGAATGKIVFDADEAERLSQLGDAVILVREETSPEDIHGMHAARGIVKFVKDRKLKVQAAIQGDQLRVTSSSKDELQKTIGLLRAEDFGVELKFGNYRD